jgi:hypothetical protein
MIQIGGNPIMLVQVQQNAITSIAGLMMMIIVMKTMLRASIINRQARP